MPAEYIPLLKWKQGEQLALANLQSAERQRVCPVLEIIPSAVQGKTTGPDGLAPDTSGTLVKDIISAWGSNPVFVDFTPLDPEWRPTSKKHFIDHFFEEARHVGQNWIPVATMQSDAAFRTAVAAATKVDNRGACIRVNINDVVDDAFPKELKELRKALGLTPAELDLLIDAANLGTHNLALISTAARGAVGSIPELKAWRSVAFSGTSFPESLAALPYGLSTIVREEWRIWQKLQTIADNTRPIIFADYTAGNANLPEGGFVGAANIRYATDDEWIILKGHKATDDTHGGYEQFHDLAMLLIKDHRFCGPDFSWGDKYIADCAHRTVKSGNLSTWRAVATNHHITFVLAQLAKQATAGA